MTTITSSAKDPLLSLEGRFASWSRAGRMRLRARYDERTTYIL